MGDVMFKGVEIVLGGKVYVLGGLFYELIILINVISDMLVINEEIFGFVVFLFKFDKESEVVMVVNDMDFGLVFYFYFCDLVWVWCVFEVLDFGMVGVNIGLILIVEVFFGGVKMLGFGREGFCYGLEDFMEMKYVCMGGIDEV